MTPSGGPLLLYLQGAALDGLATDATGASNITNDEFSLFVQDQWQPRNNLTINYGLRWDAQIMPETDRSRRTTVYGTFLDDPTFPSDGTIPDQLAMFQPRGGVAWDVKGDGRRCCAQRRHLFGAPEHAVAGRVGDDERPSAADAVRQHGQLHGIRCANAGLAGGS